MWIFWIVVKLIAMAIGMVIGLANKKTGKTGDQIYKEKLCHLSVRTHKGSITGRSVGIDYRGPKFRMVPEGKWDVRFKAWGLSTETQTGDEDFDDSVYVISDNPLLATHLSLSQETRDAIRGILDSDYHEVKSDGNHLWISANGNKEPDDYDLDRIVDLGEKMEGLKGNQMFLLSEPFYAKAVFAEAVLYALGGYAFVGFMEMLSARETLILHPMDSYTLGLGAAVVLFALMISAIRFFFQGSSRGHRVILESALLLILSLPFAGIQLLVDLNVGLDKSEQFVVTATVSNVRQEYHKTKNGHYYTYHAELQPGGNDKVKLPDEIAVSSAIYRGRTGKTKLDIALHEGAFGLPWITGLRWQ